MKEPADPASLREDTAFSLEFPRNLPDPTHTLGFRSVAEDFQVVETLGFAPLGSGEHLYLEIRKTNENTRWVAHQLAEFYDVSEHAVGYCGMKDRRAVTTQWFSVHLPGRAEGPNPELPGVEILKVARHGKKLRPGMHAGNRFIIMLRGEQGMQADLNQRLETIVRVGVPNYFGEQRFGRGGNNLREVAGIVASRHPRFKGRRGGLYLSAARAWLFNQVLAQRVESGRWRDVADGPLWGRGRLPLERQAADEEQAILAPWRDWCLALEHSGLKQERRVLALAPQDLRWQWEGGNLQLNFSLPPGTFATALLRELADLEAPDVSDPVPHFTL